MSNYLKKTWLLSFLILCTSVFTANAAVLLDEDFESTDYFDNTLPEGWDNSASVTSYKWENWWMIWESKFSMAIKYRTVSAPTGSIAVLKTPSYEFGVENMQLVFDYVKVEASNFSVYISTDGGATYEDNLLFTTGDGLNQEAYNASYVTETINLREYAGNSDVRIVFVAVPSVGRRDATIYLDNIKIEPAPLCPDVQNFNITEVGATSASINWELNPEIPSIPASYNVVVKNASTGVEVINKEVEYDETSPYVIEGLTKNTEYTIKVQSICDLQGTSIWSSEYAFKTLCDAVSLPYSYDFADEAGCFSTNGDVTFTNTVAAGVGDDKSALVNATEGNYAYLATPALDFATNNMEMTFKAYGNRNTEFQVYATNNVADFSAAIPIGNVITIDKGNTWSEFSVNTSELDVTEKGYSLIIYVNSGKNTALYIDDISVIEKPTCARPTNLQVTNITNNSATFSWEKGQEGVSYNLKINDEIINVENETYTHTTLIANTEYIVSVSQKCSETEESVYSLAQTFITLCPINNDININESFEVDGFPYDCWISTQTIFGEGEGTDYVNNAWTISTEKAYEGEKSLELIKSKQGTHTELILPGLRTTSNESHELRFYMYRSDSENSIESVKVWVNDKANIDGATELASISEYYNSEPTEKSSGWYEYTYPIAKTGDVFVIIEGISENTNSIFIDNLQLRKRPSCLPAVRLSTDTITDKRIEFSWTTEAGSATEWRVSYKINDEAEVSENVTETRYVIDNLTPNTDYSCTIKVEGVCGGNYSEAKELTTQFRTLCEPEALPYLEDFEDFASVESCWAFPLKDYYYAQNTGVVEAQTNEIRTDGVNVVISPAINVDTWEGKRISFYSHGIYEKNFRVGIVENQKDSSTFVLLEQYFSPSTNIKNKYVIDITKEIEGRHICFITDDSKYQGFVYFDNLKVELSPECADVEHCEVDNLTSTTADVVITDNVNTSWEIQYSTLPFNEAAAEVSLSDKNYAITGLSADTEYGLRIRSLCGTGDKGLWCDVIEFKTSCEGFVVTKDNDFFEGFENGYSAGIVGGCWRQKTIDGSVPAWTINSDLPAYQSSPNTGDYNAYIKTESDNSLFYPVVLKANTNYKISCFAEFMGSETENLFVDICKNSSDLTGGTNVFSATTGGSYKEFYSYFVAPTDGTYYLRITNRNTNAWNYLSIDDIRIKQVDCAPPSVAAVDANVTPTSVVLSWLSTAAKHEIKIASSEINPATSEANIYTGEINASTLTVDDLDPNTIYYYYIKSICSDNDESIWSDMGVFETPCATYDVPFVEGFDTDIDNLNCWTHWSENVPTVSDFKKYSGKNSWQVMGGFIVLPTLNIDDLSKYQFSSFIYSELDTVKLTVGVMTDPKNEETFLPISEIVVTSKGEWKGITSYFYDLARDEYSDYADAKNIAIVISDDYIVYLDDIKVEQLAECPKITGLSVGSITQESLEVSWYELNDEEWQIEIVNDGVVERDTTVTASPVTIGGLKANTEYDVRVRTNCTATSHSQWESSIVRTTCLDIVTLPFFEDFNSLEDDQYITCWINDAFNMNNSSDYNLWKSYVGVKTPTPAYEFDSEWNTENNYSILESPLLDLTDLTSATLEFDAMNDKGKDLQVLLSLDNGVNFDEVLISSIKGVDTLTHYTVDLSEYVGQKVAIGFKGISGEMGRLMDGDPFIRLDNISVYETPSCEKPTAIEIVEVTHNSVDIKIVDDNASATQWEVAIAPMNTPLNEVTDFTLITSKTYQFTGVNAATYYIVYARTVCDATNKSWTIASSPIVTECDKYALPYFNNFENATSIEKILCTNVISKNAQTSIETYQPNAYAGSQCLAFRAEGDYAYFVLPEVEEAIDNISLSFYYRNTTMQEEEGSLEVGIIPLYLDTTDFILLKTYSINDEYTLAGADFAHAELDPKLTASDYRIALRYKSKAEWGTKTVFVDDITIRVSDDCIAPLRVDVSSMGSAVEVTIVDNVNTQWDLAYGLINTAMEDLTLISNITSKVTTIDELAASSFYKIYARANCDGTVTDWSDVTNFVSTCSDIVVDPENEYSENFELTPHNTVPNCWNVVSAEDRGDFIYPAVKVGGGKSTLAFMGRNSTIEMPSFATALNILNLEFDAQFTGYGTGKIKVSYKDEITNDIVLIEEVEIQTELKRFLVDLTALPNSAKSIVFNQSEGFGASIDNIRATVQTQCFTPKNVTATATESSLSIDFVSSLYGDNAEYILSKDGVTEETAWTTTRPITIDNLEPNTEYTISIRTECSKEGEPYDTSAWSLPVAFSTYQTPASEPYTDGGFENATENSLWLFASKGANQWIISDDANAVKEGSNALFVSSDGATNNYDITSASKSWAYRTFKIGKGVHNIAYSYKVGGSTTDYFRAYLVPASIDLATAYENTNSFIPIDGGSPIHSVNEWTTFETEIAVETEGYYNIAFLWKSNAEEGTQAPAAIDNVTIEASACATLLNAEIQYVMSNYATIMLNDYNETVSSYQAIVKQGDKTISQDDIDAAQNLTATDGLLTVNGLNAQSEYIIYLRAICNANDTSAWSPMIEIVTPCSPTVVTETNSLQESFESYRNGATIADCWDSNGLWRAGIVEEGYGLRPRTGDRYAYLGANKKDTLSTLVTLEAGKTYKLSLWARTEAGQSNITTRYKNVADADENIITLTTAEVTSAAYQNVSAEFTVAEDGDYTIMIGAKHKSMMVNYLLIDDVSLTVLCEKPSDISVRDVTGESATLVWTAYSDNTHIEISSSDYDLDTTVESVAGENTLAIEGLSMATEYSVSLTNICNQSSSESVEYNFMTLCGAISLPYREDFEDYENGKLPMCWDNSEGTVLENYKWQVATIKEDGKDNKVMKFDSQSSKSGDTNILKFVSFNVPRSGYILDFDYKNPKGGAMTIALSTDGGATEAETLVDAATNVEEWTTFTASLDAYSSDDVTVIVKSTSNDAAGDAFHYLDNINVSCKGDDVNIYDTICQNSTYRGNGFVVYSRDTKVSGTKILTKEIVSTVEGECNYNLVLNLFIAPSYDIIIEDTFCKGETYNNGVFADIEEPGVYYEEYTTAYGCDSVVTLHLAYGNKEVELLDTICEGDTYSFGGDELSISGPYRYTTEGVSGCDSTTNLYLTVIPKYYVQETTICEGETIEFEGESYAATGRYEHAFKNVSGCDSIRLLDLTVLVADYVIDTTICEGKSIYFNGEYQTTSGTYKETFIRDESGCDSTVTLNITVVPADTVEYSDYVCEGKAYFDYGFIDVSITKDSVLYRTELNEDNCNSVVKLNLSMSPTQTVFDTIEINQGDVYDFGGTSITSSGNYNHTFENEYGCDSIVNLHVKVITGVNTIKAQPLTLSPNPIETFGYTFIDRDWTAEEQNNMSVEIITATGEKIYHSDVTKFPITIGNINVSGMYYVRIITGNGNIYIGKLIVK